jgi:hypothetical protein
MGCIGIVNRTFHIIQDIPQVQITDLRSKSKIDKTDILRAMTAN